MSRSIVLVPLAIAVISSSADGLSYIVDACSNSQQGKSEKIQTKYRSEDLLKKTLEEYGAAVRVDADGGLTADFGVGKIRYERPGEDLLYEMQIYDVQNLEDMLCSIREIESEYHSNVQSYTYHRVKSHLADNMTIQSEEVLEDNSILITLTME